MSLPSSDVRLTIGGHIAAAFTALVILWAALALLSTLLSRLNLAPPSAGLYIPDPGNGVEATQTMIRLGSALSDGRTVVLLGSSELMQTRSFMPYRYLPKELGIPVLAIGRGYFQSFAIYEYLSANDRYLSDSTRLVILVSPGWFKEDSIPFNFFLTYFPAPVLARLLDKDAVTDLMRDYVTAHWSLVEKSSATLSLFGPQTNSGAPRQRLWAWIRSGTRRLREQAIGLREQAFTLRTEFDMLLHTEASNSHSTIAAINTETRPVAPDWEALRRVAQERELAVMTNNPMYVRDDYYTRYLKDRGRTEYFPAGMDPKGEMQMLETLLRYLQSRHVHALIVMEPLNPYTFSDASRARALGNEVAALCASTAMPYYDMTQSDYIPGTLSDAMHVGELGWVLIDEKIERYYQ